MKPLPAELKYTKTHEWVKTEDDGSVTIGITDHAQALLGDMVFVELPDVDKAVEKEKEMGVLESVKAAADLYSPLSGKITATNGNLQIQPELINQDPYGDGWICKIKPSHPDELKILLSSTDYEKEIA